MATERVGMATVRGLLDEALIRLSQVKDGAVLLRPAAALLEDALHASYLALAAGADYAAFHEGARRAREASQRTLEALQDVASDDPATNEALRLVAQAFGSLRHIGYRSGEDSGLTRRTSLPPLVRACRDEPQLIYTGGDLVRPRVPLPELEPPDPPEAPPPEAPPPITSVDELEAAMERSLQALQAFEEPAAGDEPAEGDLPPERDEDEAVRLRFGAVVPIAEQITEQARLLVVDLANLGRMRRVEPGEGWSWGLETERRLVRRLDGLIACGEETFPELVALLEDRPVPDPELTWALLFLFGSVYSHDLVDQCWRLARTVDLAQPELVEAVSDALAFAPNPNLSDRLGDWLADPDPRRREVAVRALARRRSLTPRQLAGALGDSDREVRLAATRAAALTVAAPADLLNRALQEGDEEILRAAMWAAVLRKRRAGVDRALELLSEGRPSAGDAALLAAVAGGEEGRRALGLLSTRNNEPTLIRALGWLGDLSHADLLLHWLGEGDEGQRMAALGSLERLTGASISEVSPEGVERDEPPFAEGFFGYEPEPELSDAPELWWAWWKRHRARAESDLRYRYGHAYSLHDSLWELEGEDFTNGRREVAQVELIAWSGGTLPLDRDDFVVRQRRQLAAWREYLSHRMSLPVRGWRSNLIGAS